VTRASGAVKALFLVGWLGAAAGAANAWLCVSGIPEAVHDNPSFGWPLVPAGALHGAMLGLIPVAGFLVASQWRATVRFLVAIPVGWLAGYLSWIPLCRWALDETWGKSLLWPFLDEPGLGVAWAPFAYFGVASVLFFLCLCLWGSRQSWGAQAACGTCAGVLGSLWFWSEFQPWYFAAIHGTIWGVLAGTGVYRANAFLRSKDFGVAEHADAADEAQGGTRTAS